MRSRERRLTHGEDYAVDLESNLFKLKQDVKEGQWIHLEKYITKKLDDLSEKVEAYPSFRKTERQLKTKKNKKFYKEVKVQI